jgi:hypothetical protein
MQRYIALIGAVFIWVTAVLAQVEHRSFDVASIKPTPPEVQSGGFRFEPGGRTVITNFTLRDLVMIAGNAR